MGIIGDPGAPDRGSLDAQRVAAPPSRGTFDTNGNPRWTKPAVATKLARVATVRRRIQRNKPPAAADPAQRRPNVRRALSHVGGRITVDSTNAELSATLRAALNVSADEGATMKHVHGFHSYPARLHPETARTVISAFSRPGHSVLDPFCGSGTVLVEARLAGRHAFGNDANPLATELSWLKARGTTQHERDTILSAAQGVGEYADEQRRKRTGASRRYPAEDVSLYDPHVLLELDGLRSGIDRVQNADLRRALRLVLSAILTKVSRRTSDSSRHAVAKRIAAGFASRLFVQKSGELVDRLARFARELPRQKLALELHRGDARKPLGFPPRSIDLVVSSPPYPGVYDYFDHHATRLRWLELPGQELEHAEMGSRRQLARMQADQAIEAWRQDFGEVHRRLRGLLRRDARILWVIADSVVGKRALRAAEFTRALAVHHGFEVEGIASQVRPYFHQHTAHAFSTRPRQEHVVLLRRSRTRREPPND